MNIGIFTDTYFPQISGVASSIATLEKELSARGHRVYIFTSTDKAANHFRRQQLPSCNVMNIVFIHCVVCMNVRKLKFMCKMLS